MYQLDVRYYLVTRLAFLLLPCSFSLAHSFSRSAYLPDSLAAFTFCASFILRPQPSALFPALRPGVHLDVTSPSSAGRSDRSRVALGFRWVRVYPIRSVLPTSGSSRCSGETGHL